MRRALVIVAFAALALPPIAPAKEISSLRVCGPQACHAVTARGALRGFIDGGYETLAPQHPGQFFAVKVRMRHDGEDAGGFTVQYVRQANLIRAEAEFGKHVWTRPAGVTARALRGAAHGLRPYPAAQLGGGREPSPAPARRPPARASSSAPGGGSSLLGPAGAGALLAVVAAAALRLRRRRSG
jgi:hypothetical protein